IENYRIAVEQKLLELPAGTCELGEPPAETALRELAEETGYRADSISELATFLMSPGILDERMYVYLATGLAPGEMALEAGEQITVLPVEWDEAMEMIRDGRIQDAKTVAGLLYYGTFKRR
ncbi:MAG: NUDIX hydrolase, partial [Pirellulales bacterium]|nr:NUDIX hydrolase [Pirellulales bacterium]